MTGLRFGIIGCGAISEALYLPALARTSICSEFHLLDTEPSRLSALARTYGAKSHTTSLADLMGKVDVAVIATPPLTHDRIATTLLTAGKHVFCEKPMTIRPSDAESLVRLATAANAILMVNHHRRGFPSMARIRQIVQKGELGRLLEVIWVEGYKPTWPTQSGYYYIQRTQDGLPGSGVLLDMGAHVIDLLCWWFGTAPQVTECQTDSYGGPDSRARISLDFDGTPVTVDLGSYVRMTNVYRLTFEHGTIRGKTSDPARFELRRNDAKRATVVDCGKGGNWARVLVNFVAVVGGQERPIVTGQDVLPSIRTIAEGYRVAAPFDEPWLPKWSQP